MSSTTHVNSTELPAFPGTRLARCPLDPPPEYSDWRQAQGLTRALWRGKEVWVVSRYADIRQALSDPRISADDRTPGFPMQAPPTSGIPQAFARMDDPEHARLRRMLTGEFTVKQVRNQRPHVEELVDHFLEKMVREGQPADLVDAFALPIPSMVISQLLGVPYAEHEFFQQHSATLMSPSTAEAQEAASAALFGYLYELVARKEQAPADDLISRQLQRVATGEISRETVVVNALSLLIAGHETTANMISLSTLALLQNPELATRLRDTDDAALIANIVEELLRYLTIPQDAVFRAATEDLTLGGQPIKAGDALIMNLPSANRDEAFTADPDLVDGDRNLSGHLAFGYGTHQCIGQNLARVELQIALPALLRRLPNLRLAVPPEELEFRNGTITYGLHRLPVAW
ncbi:cytochrome P450 [Promicromonospora sp. NPDC023805]|uniref:cytochrome P450 n=1 Tax=Promicromonospora sp. NPDC023805 TaxID=3154696 RepID=UPI00340FF123